MLQPNLQQIFDSELQLPCQSVFAMQVTLKLEALASMFHISSKTVSSHISRLKTSLVEQALESGSFEQLQGKLSTKNVIGWMYDILARLWNPVADDCPSPDAEFLATQNTSPNILNSKGSRSASPDTNNTETARAAKRPKFSVPDMTGDELDQEDVIPADEWGKYICDTAEQHLKSALLDQEYSVSLLKHLWCSIFTENFLAAVSIAAFQSCIIVPRVCAKKCRHSWQ